MNTTIFLWILIALSIQTTLAYRKDPYTCSSIEIKVESDLQKIRKCIRVDGYIQITNLRITKTDSLSTNIEEIGDYLLVYRVEGLDSLLHVFPNLTIIRGHNLLFDRYALVVYENRELRNLGLKSMLKVRNGNIKIESNPVLCYVKTVNWIQLFDSYSKQHFSIKDNQNDNECPRCVKLHEVYEHDVISDLKYFRFNCWSKDHYQLKNPMDKEKDCPDHCENKGCTFNDICCSLQCLTSCIDDNCRICKDYKDYRGKCIPRCTFPFFKLRDKCINENQCRDMGLIPHAGNCIEKCPPSFVKDKKKLACILNCMGNYTIRSRNDLDVLKDCIIVHGSITINLKGDKTDNIIDAMEHALGGIVEIRDYLKVLNSPQITSLAFFKKLHTIRGENLIDNEVALFVVDNYHLEEIWGEQQTVAIFKGRIFFHLNPRLCYEKIIALGPSIKSYGTIESRDASHNSNGERNLCGTQVRLIFPEIEAINATAARVKLVPLLSSDRYYVLGYMYYYKEAPLRNVTLYDGRHGCGLDDWKMDLRVSPNIRHVFANLKPNTQYAYFVRALSTIDNNFNSQDFYSKIQYFITDVAKPGPVQKIYALQIGYNAVAIHWWPPKNMNGVIQKYLVRSEIIPHHIKYSQIYGYGTDQRSKDCECGIHKIIRGAAPSESDYHRREEAVFETAVQNFIYISKRDVERRNQEKIDEDKTRGKREVDSTTPTTTTPKVDRGEILRKHLEEMERKALLEQDTGTNQFPIIRPRMVCSRNITTQGDCDPIECYPGQEVSPTLHSYIFEKLKPETIYTFYVRACVKGLVNNCGPEKSVELETHAKKLHNPRLDEDFEIINPL